MNQSELIDKVARATELNQRAAGQAGKAVLNAILASLVAETGCSVAEEPMISMTLCLTTEFPHTSVAGVVHDPGSYRGAMDAGSALGSRCLWSAPAPARPRSRRGAWL